MLELTWNRAERPFLPELPAGKRARDYPERYCAYCRKWVAAWASVMVRSDGKYAHRSCWLTHNPCDLATPNLGVLSGLPTCCRIHRQRAAEEGAGKEQPKRESWREQR